MPGSAQGWDQDQGEDPRDNTIDLPRVRETTQQAHRPAPRREPGSHAQPSRGRTQPSHGHGLRGSARRDPASREPAASREPGSRDPGRDLSRGPGYPGPAPYGRGLTEPGGPGSAAYQPGRSAPPPDGVARSRQHLPPAEPPLTGLPPAEPALSSLPPAGPQLTGLPYASPPAVSVPPSAAPVPPAVAPAAPPVAGPPSDPGSPDPALAALAERIRELQALAAAPSPPVTSPPPPDPLPASPPAGHGDVAGAGQPTGTASGTTNGSTAGAAPGPQSERDADAAQSPANRVRTGQYDPVSDRQAAVPAPAGENGLAPLAGPAPDRMSSSTPAASTGFSAAPASPGTELDLAAERAVEPAASQVVAYQSPAYQGVAYQSVAPARRDGLRGGLGDSISMPRDRPARGSLAELRLRLERLPAGHPSSPYDDTGALRPPPQQLRQLELPLADDERHAEPPARASLLAATSGSSGRLGRLSLDSGPSSDTSSNGTADGAAGLPAGSASGPASTPPPTGPGSGTLPEPGRSSRSDPYRSGTSLDAFRTRWGSADGASSSPGAGQPGSARNSSAATATTGDSTTGDGTTGSSGTGNSGTTGNAAETAAASRTGSSLTGSLTGSSRTGSSLTDSDLGGAGLPNGQPGSGHARSALPDSVLPDSALDSSGGRDSGRYGRDSDRYGRDSGDGREAASPDGGSHRGGSYGSARYEAASRGAADYASVGYSRPSSSGPGSDHAEYGSSGPDSSGYHAASSGAGPGGDRRDERATGHSGTYARPDGIGPLGSRGADRDGGHDTGSYRVLRRDPGGRGTVLQGTVLHETHEPGPSSSADGGYLPAVRTGTAAQWRGTHGRDAAAAAEEHSRGPAASEADAPAPPGRPAEATAARLTPEQERIADDELERYRTADGRNVFGGYGENGLTPAMRRVEAQLPHGKLAPDSEQFSLKSPERFKAKLARMIARSPGVPVSDLVAEIYDAARYTFVFEPEHYTDETWMVHRRLKDQGFELEARRNRWESPEAKGIRTRWRDQARNLIFEVQFHTPASWDLLQRTHDAYLRITDPLTPPGERAQLRARQVAAASTTRPPARSPEIGDFRADVR